MKHDNNSEVKVINNIDNSLYIFPNEKSLEEAKINIFKQESFNPTFTTTLLFNLEKKSISRKDEKICFNTHNKKMLSNSALTLKTENERKDKFGTIISKKNNTHKVSFKDQFNNEKIDEVKKVESYKKHNKLDPKKNQTEIVNDNACIIY